MILAIYGTTHSGKTTCTDMLKAVLSIPVDIIHTDSIQAQHGLHDPWMLHDYEIAPWHTERFYTLVSDSIKVASKPCASSQHSMKNSDADSSSTEQNAEQDSEPVSEHRLNAQLRKQSRCRTRCIITQDSSEHGNQLQHLVIIEGNALSPAETARYLHPDMQLLLARRSVSPLQMLEECHRYDKGRYTEAKDDEYLLQYFCIQQTLACKMYDEHKGSSPVIAIDTSNMDAGLQTAVKYTRLKSRASLNGKLRFAS